MRFIHTRLLVLLASAACLGAVPAWAGPSDPVPILSGSGRVPTPISYQDAAGTSQTVKPAGYKLTAVHFWATWCAPCVIELPEVDAIAEAYKGKGLQVIAISLDMKMDKVKKFFTGKKISHLSANLDNNNGAFKAAKLKGLPATLFLNENGSIVGRADGPVDWHSDATKAFIETRIK